MLSGLPRCIDSGKTDNKNTVNIDILLLVAPGSDQTAAAKPDRLEFLMNNASEDRKKVRFCITDEPRYCSLLELAEAGLSAAAGWLQVFRLPEEAGSFYWLGDKSCLEKMSLIVYLLV